MTLDKNASPVKKISEKEFIALCRLITEEDGPSLLILSNNFKAIIRSDPDWIHWVRSQKQFDPCAKIHKLMHEFHWNEIEHGFKRLWISEGRNLDLEEGLYYLSTLIEPEITREEFGQPLKLMAAELQKLLNDVHTFDQMVRTFRSYLFETQGFKGNSANYYDPLNSFLHKVLARKIGIPISLCCLCLLLAQKVYWENKPIPLIGIGLPSHFIVLFQYKNKSIYMDPFHRGKILAREDCIEILRHNDIDFKESYLDPVDPHMILCRTINNLLHIYSDLGEAALSQQLLRCLQALNAP